MESGKLPIPESNARPGTRSLPFEIDLNETPLPSPRETLAAAEETVATVSAAEGGGFSGEVVCCGCGRGVRTNQSRKFSEWKCFKCLLSNGAAESSRGGGGGGGRLLDINASPPREADGEDEQHNNKMHRVPDISFVGRSLNLSKASPGVPQIQSGFEDIVQRRLGRFSKEAEVSSTFTGGIRPSHWTPFNFSTQHQREVYLQALREYIHEKRGLLGDGWHVEFFFCKNRSKTFPVYCAPDGSRFESMSHVAVHLGLLTKYHSLGTEDRSDGLASLQHRLHSDVRRKDWLKYSRANADPMEHGRSGIELLQDVCPLQYEDFFVLSLGKVDLRPSYHNTSHIWPVGYRSCWHDKITGSLFVSDIVDGGDGGPIFKVKRCPCSTWPIPIGTTVLVRQKSDSNDGRDIVPNTDSATTGMEDDESLSIKMMLTEESPPDLEDVDFQKANSSPTQSSCFPKGHGTIITDTTGWVDCIGEFLVEGRSSSMVWEMASQILLSACHEVYKQHGILQFCCKHNVNGVNIKAADDIDSLSKFSYLCGPTDIPRSVHTNNELEIFSEMIMKWLRQDRFGLDTEFVQEFLEQLPGIHACSEYKFLNKRSRNSGSQTVRSGFLLVKRKRNVQGGRGADGSLSSGKRPRKQFGEESEIKKSFPLGKPLSGKLPAHLIGDVLQAWEFLWRFAEVIGLEETYTFQELENELMNPWLDTVNPLEGDGNEIRNSGDLTLCTGSALRKTHSSLLKVVVCELLFKVAGYVDPNSDAGECKSRRGRKKDADNSFATKKMKLDMLQINELTWPELARRYILVVLSMEGNLDSGEITCRESSKIFHCLRGDGGTLCGSLTGVAGMEADALFLAEASKKVFGSVKKNEFVSIDQEKSDTVSTPKTITVNGNEVPEWVLALEPVRKLPTNVGARIRKCVHEALNKNPPEWAKNIMEHSISKEVYKGNASGPTKRAIVSLLAEVSDRDLQPKPEKKEKVKSVSTISDLVMKQCRIVLRRAIAEDEEKAFCNLLGRTLLNHNDNDDEGLLGNPAMVSRPLDFRTVDIRLAMGSYGGSHEAFHDDVREVWNNIRTAYADQSDLVDLADSLSQKFEVMYEKEVLMVVNKLDESTNSSCISDEAQKEIDDMLIHANESSIPKAPWDEGVCKVCGVDKDDDNVLLCDTCDSEYHTYCLSPPLARIPEGNWYCPSCVARKFKSQGVSHGTRVNWYRKRRYQGEYTWNFVETLSRLARTMGSKEYWDISVEERISLMKFLCDETMNTSSLRDHLDHCASMCADLQQQLRSLSSEWKNLKIREEILAANLEKANTLDNRAGEFAPDVLASVLNKDCKSLGKLPDTGNGVPSLSGEDGPQGNGPIVYNEQAHLSISKSNSEKHNTSNKSEEGLVSSDAIGTNMAEPMLNGHHSSFQSAASALQDGNQEMSSLKHEISGLRDSISRIEYELQKVSIRKEFLGRDSAGRLYWVFDRAETSSLMVVNGSNDNNSYLRRTSQYGMENPSSSRGPKVAGVYEYMQSTSTWVSYQSDTEIAEIVGWLGDGDARERELKESILNWQRNRPKNSKCAENEKQPNCLKISNGGRAANSSFLVTNAITSLEKKYGPGLGSEATDISNKRDQKGKLPCEGRMYRCECLEPIWPSRHHCLSCHQTYSTGEELVGHNDGKCSVGSANTKNKRVDEDSLKGKRPATETSVKKRSGNSGNGRTSKSEKNNMEFNMSKFLEPGCPFVYEEIMSKFKPQSSLKELVRGVGLIGSGGRPTFVPNASPHLGDPALRLVSTRKNGVDRGKESIDVDDWAQRSMKGITIRDMDYDSGSESFAKYLGNDRYEEASKVQRSISKVSADGVGNRCKVPESSLRRLVGRVSQILRQLKINLLDMDAALPDEALRPSMAHLEKRSAWRAFVKSAGSIYEMVQAAILLENMIKADFLKKDWWYWSSLSSAASISTLSALALRIYTLDAAIIFEEPSPTSDSTEVLKPSEPEEGTSAKLDTTNDTIEKTPIDPTDNSKPKSRSNKRRRDSGG